MRVQIPLLLLKFVGFLLRITVTIPGKREKLEILEMLRVNLFGPNVPFTGKRVNFFLHSKLIAWFLSEENIDLG